MIPLVQGVVGGIALLREKHLLTAVAIAAAICCSACSGRLPQGALVPVAQANTAGASIVPMLVATTRSHATADAGDMFSGGMASQISYASIAVSLPPDAVRKIGEVQWPTSMPPDPQRSFVTVSAN